MKKKLYAIACVLLLIGIIIILVKTGMKTSQSGKGRINDNTDNINLDTIELADGSVTVDFSPVILCSQEETRKLIVSTQEATVTTNLESRTIKALDVDWLTKSQSVTYSGTGYFAVDLTKLTADDIAVDEDLKTVTIKIEHPVLETVDVDPDKIMIGKTNEGLLAKGDIKLTVDDYNTIEKQIRSKLEKAFNTAQNGQAADDNSLKMVKEVYEPAVQAVDSEYSVVVEFK